MTQRSLTLGRHIVSPPVVLAPMAGVTNAPFRGLCREFGPGLVYVNEMVMATALVHGNARTQRMITFASNESPRSLQLYGSDPVMMGEAAAKLADNNLVDHIDTADHIDAVSKRHQLRLPGSQGHATWWRSCGAIEAQSSARNPA